MKKDIYIIGGGISGLYMTYLLSEYNITISADLSKIKS